MLTLVSHNLISVSNFTATLITSKEQTWWEQAVLRIVRELD